MRCLYCPKEFDERTFVDRLFGRDGRRTMNSSPAFDKHIKIHIKRTILK